MIGVIPKVGEAAVVEEFFHLFKTPWELFQEGRTYDVVIATADDQHPRSVGQDATRGRTYALLQLTVARPRPPAGGAWGSARVSRRTIVRGQAGLFIESFNE